MITVEKEREEEEEANYFSIFCVTVYCSRVGVLN